MELSTELPPNYVLVMGLGVAVWWTFPTTFHQTTHYGWVWGGRLVEISTKLPPNYPCHKGSLVEVSISGVEVLRKLPPNYPYGMGSLSEV